MAHPVYDQIGSGYAAQRRQDPRIAQQIETALGAARTIINIGAGTGSYEPTARDVLAVEPSAVMIAQRPAEAARCVQGVAEALPAPSASFDCAMAILTIHHWKDWRLGLREMRRVARRAVVLTFEPEQSETFWLVRDYFPEFGELDRQKFPAPKEVVACLGTGRIEPVPIPHDCVDGFQCAYWRRPEFYLRAAVRNSISTFSLLGDASAGLERLAADLASGHWAERNADILRLESLDLGYRLITCELD